MATTTRYRNYFIRTIGKDDRTRYRAYSKYRDYSFNREWFLVLREASGKIVTFSSIVEAIRWIDAMERAKAEDAAKREADPHFQLVRRMYDEDANDWSKLSLEQLQQIAAWLDAAG